MHKKKEEDYFNRCNRLFSGEGKLLVRLYSNEDAFYNPRRSRLFHVLLQLIVMYLQILMLAENKPLMQKAWNYMNDSLRTEVFLRYSPETVACACIYLSARVLRITLPKNPSWFVIFGVKEEDIIDVCKRIVNLYNRGKVSESFASCLSKYVAEMKFYNDFFRISDRSRRFRSRIENIKR